MNVAAIAASLIKASRYRTRASRLSRGAAADHSHGRQPGASPWSGVVSNGAPEGRKIREKSFAPPGLIVILTENPGLAPAGARG
jgi:hypothetical protein